MKTIKELKEESLGVLEGKWSKIVSVFFVYSIIMIALGSIGNPESKNLSIVIISAIASIISLIVNPALLFGFNMYALKFSRNQEVEFNSFFDGFKYFRKAFNTYYLRSIYTFLWSLLLIVPGIVKSITYSQTLFILSDNPSISAEQAITRSMEMMNGYKWKYFQLQLSFIGWAVLSILTLGIGFLWLAPYVYVSNAKFYEDLKSKQSDNVSPEGVTENPVEPVVEAQPVIA